MAAIRLGKPLGFPPPPSFFPFSFFHTIKCMGYISHTYGCYYITYVVVKYMLSCSANAFLPYVYRQDRCMQSLFMYVDMSHSINRSAGGARNPNLLSLAPHHFPPSRTKRSNGWEERRKLSLLAETLPVGRHFNGLPSLVTLDIFSSDMDVKKGEREGEKENVFIVDK